LADTIHGSFREAAASHRDKVALRHRKDGRYVEMTYGELESWVDAVAARLVSLGVKHRSGSSPTSPHSASAPESFRSIRRCLRPTCSTSSTTLA
jgi:long-subunit acyl-CoA synthetase (AMP-forming)